MPSTGIIATKTPKIRLLRTIKKEILKLVETYIGKAEDLESVNESMVPALFEAILDDYTRNVPAARDAEVLNVTTAIVTRLQVGSLLYHVACPTLTRRHLKTLLIPQIPAVLDAVFEPTLSMISQDFIEWPEHRNGFFQLLKAIDRHCFPGRDITLFRMIPRLNMFCSFSIDQSSTSAIQNVNGQYCMGH